MSKEYEIISHNQFKYLNIFLVRLASRTPHLHGDLELGLILDGQLTVQCGDKSQKLGTGDVYLINPLDAHEFLAEGSGALILSIQLAPQFLDSFLGETPNIRFLCAPKLRTYYRNDHHYMLLCLLCVQLAYHYFVNDENYKFHCGSLAAQLYCHLKTTLPNRTISPEDYQSIKQKSDRILSITQYIDNNFTHKLLLEDIAEREHLSLHYLSHLFRDSLGISFQNYLTEKRFEYALSLISTTDRKILDISISSGFSDVRYLNRIFSDRIGCTPKEYRKNTQNARPRNAAAMQSSQVFYPIDMCAETLTSMRKTMMWEISKLHLSDLLLEQ